LIVAVDARHLAGGRGVAHYTAALLDALAARHPEDEYRAFVPGRQTLNHPPKGARPLSQGSLRVVRHRLPSRVIFGSAAVVGRPRIDRLAGGADVVWIPAPAPVAVSRGVPYVLTVNDLSWIERPSDFTPYERLWHRVGRLGRLARNAAAVVCISAATRDVALAEWGLDPARVHVIHPGVTAPEGSAAPRERPYFLAVGALEPRKAPDLLVRAYEHARIDGLRADLVFAGEGRLAVWGEGVHVLGRVDALGSLYANALALVMPSYLEGFGFPPLEAALAGTPSIVSDLPVFGETLGDAALKVPPGDERALADALLRMERDVDLRARLARDAAQAARKLTWDEAARRLHEVLEAVA
jgi:glycosyltransferase involved in cell wall biosynthesis